MKKVNRNIYHHEYIVGEYLTLIQFHYQRVEHVCTVLSCEELMTLIAKRKINCHYVNVKKVVMKVVERVEYDMFTAGFVGVVDHLGLSQIGVGHYQYPSYELALKAKFLWKVYWLDFSPGGRVLEEVYEDKSRVAAVMEDKYVPARLRMALGLTT